MANIPKYSARKNVAYLNPEYSVMWPATISDSPSGTSNGVRFDSTRPETKNKMNAAAPHGVKTNQRGTNAKRVAALRRDNRIGRKRADDHHDRKHGDDQRQFVADHLRDRAHRAEHRELVVAPPAGHEHRELRGRTNGKEKQNAAVDRKRRHVSAVRNHAKGKNRRRRDQDRREKMHDLIRARRHDVFLDQHLDAVGHRLKKSEWPDAIRSVAILDPPENFPLQHRDEREERQEHAEDRENIDQTRSDLNNPARRARKPRQEPLLCNNKDLINRLAHVGMKKTVN